MSAVPENQRLLSAATYALIDRECAKFPAQQRQSAVIPALAHAQRQLGWLSDEVLREVADYLGMAPIAVYEVATFYNMFDLAQPGRFKITVCTNLPCALSGANQAAAHLKRKLGIDFGETTADGCFTLKEGECMGACGDAPVLIVNNERMESFMSDDKLDSLIDELRGKERS
ncbi:MAG TPA: NADH-quinone oxidoreductase subunit NuoE [Burkholderiaceae bacterium]|jgi:NADH-quinone oxidoreductase subunit E|nr:NADH-quinone oxidoreductase subunit NuoE [Burkholderiaceae bacterium]HPE01777.1 NADH-quinone oxidoreductase subunit NuoE [Burkholderiaceae bacterium]HRZ01880.1 NADH-quinone oxidoreductase subunit NuoE [Burkholderiaceae bacterium]